MTRPKIDGKKKGAIISGNCKQSSKQKEVKENDISPKKILSNWNDSIKIERIVHQNVPLCYITACDDSVPTIKPKKKTLIKPKGSIRGTIQNYKRYNRSRSRRYVNSCRTLKTHK